MKKRGGLFFIFILLGGCADNYSSVMKRGKEFLERGEYDRAIEEFKKVASEGRCEPNYGIFLAELQGIFGELTGINNKLKSFMPQQYGDILEVFLRETLSLIEERLREMGKAYENMERTRFCEFEVTLPIHIEIGNSTIVDVSFGRTFGEIEARIIGFMNYLLLSALDLLFSHNLKANAVSLLSGFLSMDRSSIVGMLRSLGFLFNDNPDFLKWHPDEKERERFNSVPSEMARAFGALHGVLSSIPIRGKKEGYVLEYEDTNLNGLIDANERIKLNMWGTLSIRGYEEEIEPYEASLPIWVQAELLLKADEFLGKISDALLGKRNPGELYHLSELNGLLLAFGFDQMPDIIAIDPIAFFRGPFDITKKSYPDSPKPLREMAPYWFYDRLEKKVVLGIEGEVKESLGVYTYYLTSGDAPHFPPEGISFEGKKVNIFLLPDCVEVPLYQPDYVTLFYVAFRDPTFNGSLFVNLSTVKTYECDNSPKPYYSDFSPPDLYGINKALAILFMKYGSILIPQ